MSDATSVVHVRDAEAAELDALAHIWYDGWQDAHAEILPAALARARTLERFRDRLSAGLVGVRATGPVQAPTGFCMTKGAELYQLFVSRQARGTGVAAALVADAERRIADGGADIAWLDCAIGNLRAARFYEKCGWRRAGTVSSELDTPDGVFTIEVWRYEKVLRGRERKAIKTTPSDYHPIDCALHDRLEAAATLGTKCVLKYLDDDTVVEIEDRLIDVFARGNEEFVRTASGLEVRLDNIVSLDAVPFRR